METRMSSVEEQCLGRPYCTPQRHMLQERQELDPACEVSDSGYIFIPFPSELLSLDIPEVAHITALHSAVAVISGNFQAWFNLNSSPSVSPKLTPSSNAGYLLVLWGWQEKTLRLSPSLLPPSPHLIAVRAWTALGSTHMWEMRLQDGLRREEKAGKHEEIIHHIQEMWPGNASLVWRTLSRSMKNPGFSSSKRQEQHINIKGVGWGHEIHKYVWVSAHMKD